LCWCRTSIGPTRTAGPGFGPPAACWHDSPQPADPPRSAAQHRGLQCTQRARHDERPPAPASGARHEMSCGLLRLALDTRCLAGSSAAGCAASSCRETCASSSDSSATPYPLGLAVFLDEEPVPVAAARAGTVPWATAARRSAPDARHLLAPCPCLRHLRAPCPCLQASGTCALLALASKGQHLQAWVMVLKCLFGTSFGQRRPRMWPPGMCACRKFCFGWPHREYLIFTMGPSKCSEIGSVRTCIKPKWK
jgi:hypothetical protein